MSERAYRKAMEGVPRALVVVERRSSKMPLGRKSIRPGKAADMWRPLVNEMVAGRVPIDDSNAELYAMVLDQDWKRVQREARKGP